MRMWLKKNWLYSIAVLFGAFLIAYSLNGLNVIAQYDIQYYNGSYVKHEVIQKPSTQGKISVRYLHIGDLVFYVDSISLQAFDIAFLSEVKPGDALQVAYWKESRKPQLLTDNRLLSVQKGSVRYMDQEETVSFVTRNYYLGLILGALFALCGVVAICFRLK